MSDPSENAERGRERESLRPLDSEGNLNQYETEGGAENSHSENTDTRGSQDLGEIDRRSRNGENAIHPGEEAEAEARSAQEAERANRRAEKAEAALVRKEEAMRQQEIKVIAQRGRKAEEALCREEEATRQ